MTEPKRLLEASPNELTRAVLRAGKSYQASSNARRTTLAALGVAGSSALFAKSAAASTTFKQWIVGGLLGGAVIGAGAVGVTLLEEPSADVAPAAGAPGLSNPAAPAAPPLAASPPSEPPPALQQPAAPEPLPPALEPSNAPAPAAAPPSRSPPAAAEPNSNNSLAAELEALDSARRALSAGNGGQALQLLDAHGRRFPRGRLRLEAEVLRIEALMQTGQRAAASARAKAFVKRYPNSVFVSRVQRFAGP